MNKTLKLLILSDIFVFGGLGLINPIMAIFIKENLIGGTIAAVGIVSAIYLVTNSILQILFAKVFNPKDRFWMLCLGTFFIVLVPFGYIFSTKIWHIYLIELIHGVGAGFAFPSWSSLFTSNLEKGARGYQSSLHSAGVNMGMAITASSGAILAQLFNFRVVFLITGCISLIGLLILFLLEKKNLKKF
ncbi:MAG: MFS transporter [Candidatus Nanoarchaeia archaeon]|nr:MFS transporter [Candidatus Nanoarchaeia archaeon]